MTEEYPDDVEYEIISTTEVVKKIKPDTSWQIIDIDEEDKKC